MMQNIRKLMINYPLLSVGIIFPICLVIITGMLNILLKFILPVFLAFWMSSIIYTSIIGKNPFQYYSNPFWFIKQR